VGLSPSSRRRCSTLRIPGTDRSSRRSPAPAYGSARPWRSSARRQPCDGHAARASLEDRRRRRPSRRTARRADRCARRMEGPESGDSADRVFVCRSRRGRRAPQTEDKIGRRLKTTIRKANRGLMQAGIEPISERVSPHSLRSTHASLRGALRDDPIYIGEQIGHSDPRFTLSEYAKGREAPGAASRQLTGKRLIARLIGPKSAESRKSAQSRRRGDRPRTYRNGLTSG
jgi:integrase